MILGLFEYWDGEVKIIECANPQNWSKFETVKFGGGSMTIVYVGF